MLIASFVQMMQQGMHSYAVWSSCLAKMIRGTVSKQGVWNRINVAFIMLLKELVNSMLKQIAHHKWDKTVYAFFEKVWVEDSTCVGLPDSMLRIWKGNRSYGQQKSVVKIHVALDVMSGKMGYCDLESYTTSEQALSKKIIGMAKAGDLLIRDLGYFVIETFKQLDEKKIYFLSRKRYGIKLYAPRTGKELTIKQLVKHKNFVDREVYIGAEKKCKVRPVAVRLNREQKQARIEKAKKDRDKRVNHGKQYYFELGYAVFITNVGKEIWTPEQLVKAYRVRWNIEILIQVLEESLSFGKHDTRKQHPHKKHRGGYLSDVAIHCLVSIRILPHDCPLCPREKESA